MHHFVGRQGHLAPVNREDHFWDLRPGQTRVRGTNDIIQDSPGSQDARDQIATNAHVVALYTSLLHVVGGELAHTGSAGKP